MGLSSIHDELTDYFASLLRTPRERVATDVNVLELGADSIMLMEARSWIEARHGQRIEIQRFFLDLNSIDALSAFLAEHATEPSAPPVVAAARAVALPAAGSAAVAPSSADLQLMHAQLALVAEVIEAQNRAVRSMRRSGGDPAVASPVSEVAPS